MELTDLILVAPDHLYPEFWAKDNWELSDFAIQIDRLASV
jgi:hypothetical protein